MQASEQLQYLRFLTKKQAAQYLNIDIVTLNHFISEGFLPVAKIGKRTYRIDIQDIDKCIEQLKA